MKYPALSAVTFIAIAIVPAPAAALPSAGERPSAFVPQWFEAGPATGFSDRGLPIMTLARVGLLPAWTVPALAAVAVHANRAPVTLGASRRISVPARRISARRAIYARFKIKSRLPLPTHESSVFLGGLY